MSFARIVRHLTATSWGLRRCFGPASLDAIEQAVAQCERHHGGEIRVAIEGQIDLAELLRNVTPRERAIQAFSQLGVWDTQGNNGVLIYVLWADHDVEIVADRGYNGRVTGEQWREVCARMERLFAKGDSTEALVLGILDVGNLIAQHFPAEAEPRNQAPNELPDRPIML